MLVSRVAVLLLWSVCYRAGNEAGTCLLGMGVFWASGSGVCMCRVMLLPCILSGSAKAQVKGEL